MYLSYRYTVSYRSTITGDQTRYMYIVQVQYADVQVYLGVPSLAITCASTLQIRYTGHNSVRWPQDEELDKIQNTSRTNAKCQLDKYKMPTTVSLIDSAWRLHTSLQRHPSSSHTGGEILEI